MLNLKKIKMLHKLLIVLIFIVNFKLSAKDSTSRILTQFGLTAVSFIRGEGMKLGALTAGICYIHFDKYAFDFEYYNFSYRYGFEKNYTNTYKKDGNTFGYPRQVDMKVFKIGAGIVKKFNNISLIPYLNLQYRYSVLGNEFYWFSDNIDHFPSIAYSPFNSLGFGIGSSINVSVVKRFNISADFSFNKFFDKGKIYTPIHYGSDNYKEFTSEGKGYKPLNNVLNLQLKIGYIFSFKKKH